MNPDLPSKNDRIMVGAGMRMDIMKGQHTAPTNSSPQTLTVQKMLQKIQAGQSQFRGRRQRIE